jgi:hypothetical protein
MENKEFVPYAESLALEKLEFDDFCFAWHVSETYGLEIGGVVKEDLIRDAVLAPTFSQAFRFFREKMNIPSHLELLHNGWDYVIYSRILKEINYNDGPFQTYEEAELACLRKLIEISNEK